MPHKPLSLRGILSHISTVEESTILPQGPLSLDTPSGTAPPKFNFQTARINKSKQIANVNFICLGNSDHCLVPEFLGRECQEQQPASSLKESSPRVPGCYCSHFLPFATFLITPYLYLCLRVRLHMIQNVWGDTVGPHALARPSHCPPLSCPHTVSCLRRRSGEAWQHL